MPEDRSVLTRPARDPDHTTAYGSLADQVVDWYLPEQDTSSPVVVFVHGGYWRPEYDRTHARSTAAGLAAAGYRTALIEYRRIPGDPDAMIEDVTRALQHCSQHAGPAASVVVGHSAGGHLALVAAARTDLPVSGCVALAPLASLAEADARELDDGAVRAFLGTPATDRPDLDPCLLPTPAIPVVVLHGEDDTLVPLDLSRAYAQTHGIPVHTVPGAGHFTLIDPADSAWDQFLTHLQRITASTGIE